VVPKTIGVAKLNDFNAGEREVKMPSPRKTQIVNSLSGKLTRAKGLVLTGFEGLSVPEVEALRTSLREAGAEYQVVKNTLLKLALEANPKFEIRNPKLEGPTAVVLSYEDELQPLKVVSDFAAEHEKFAIKGGFFEGVWQAAEKLLEIAALPCREALVAKLVRMLQSPVVRFVSVTKSNQVNLVSLLRAINRK
jgi:large subunit ribosomal protein L10